MRCLNFFSFILFVFLEVGCRPTIVDIEPPLDSTQSRQATLDSAFSLAATAFTITDEGLGLNSITQLGTVAVAGSSSVYPVGTAPMGIAFDPVTQSVWVINYSSSTISKVNIASGTKTDYDVSAVAINPRWIAFDSETNSVWMMCGGWDQPETLIQMTTGGGGTNSGEIVYSSGGYFNTQGFAFDSETHSVWRGQWDNQTLSKISTGAAGTTRGARADYSFSGVWNDRPVGGFAIDPETHSVWWGGRGNDIGHVYTGAGSTTLWAISGYGYTDGPATPITSIAFDSVTHSLWVTDTNASNTIKKISTGGGGTTAGALIGSYPVGATAYNATFDSVTNSVWVANNGSNTVGKINITTGAKVDYAVGAGPYAIAFDSISRAVWVGNSTDGTVSKVAIEDLYPTQDTFVSEIFDLGSKVSFTTLSWTGRLSGQTITMKARSSANADMSGAQAWGSCSAIQKNADLSSGGCVVDGHQYVQYQATLSTTNPGATPALDSVTIGFKEFLLSGSFISSVYDTGSEKNSVDNITWSASNTDANNSVKLQVRSSPDGVTWSGWCGASSACAGSDYFTLSSGVSGGIPADHPLRTGGNDRYLQYQVFLTSAGYSTPTLTSVSPKYSW